MIKIPYFFTAFNLSIKRYFKFKKNEGFLNAKKAKRAFETFNEQISADEI